MDDTNDLKTCRTKVYMRYLSGKVRNVGAQSYRIVIKEHAKWCRSAEGRFNAWLPIDCNDSILDIGCGRGFFLRFLEQRGHRDLVGVDLSAEQISIAAEICQYSQLITGDTNEYLKECDRKFDVISCLNVLEHLTKFEIFELLDLLSTRMNPGGRLIIETPNAASPWFGTVAYGDLTHEWFFTPRSLGDTLLLTGFSNYAARSTMHFSRLDARTVLRLIAWKAISGVLAFWNIVETGGSAGGIYTRVFVATATKS